MNIANVKHGDIVRIVEMVGCWEWANRYLAGALVRIVPNIYITGDGNSIIAEVEILTITNNKLSIFTVGDTYCLYFIPRKVPKYATAHFRRAGE